MVQTHLLSLAGAPVALAARGHHLAAVWHAAAPTAGGDQCLYYALYDVAGGWGCGRYALVAVNLVPAAQPASCPPVCTAGLQR